MELDDKCQIRKYYFTLKNGEFVTIKDQTVCSKLVETEEKKEELCILKRQANKRQNVVNKQSPQERSALTIQTLLNVMRTVKIVGHDTARLNTLATECDKLTHVLDIACIFLCD